MNLLSLIAPAKINLYLEIVGDRPDGYHELVMILQSVDLADRIDLKINGSYSITIDCSHPEVPADETNLAYKAARLMSEEFSEAFAKYGGVDITIDKKIPVAAGLAGGSTDAAAVLVGINQLWALGLTQPELQTLAAKIGSDIPFCISGGTAIATGRGEQLDPIQDLGNLWAVLAKYKDVAVSTAGAYRAYREQFGSQYPKDPETIRARAARVRSEPIVSAIAREDAAAIGQLLHNDLEKVVLPENKRVARLKDICQQAGGLGTMMSGSGPTVFTICETEAEAREVKQKIRNNLDDSALELWVSEFSSAGIQIAVCK